MDLALRTAERFQDKAALAIARRRAGIPPWTGRQIEAAQAVMRAWHRRQEDRDVFVIALEHLGFFGRMGVSDHSPFKFHQSRNGSDTKNGELNYWCLCSMIQAGKYIGLNNFQKNNHIPYTRLMPRLIAWAERVLRETNTTV